jgi:hypothetical protein
MAAGRSRLVAAMIRALMFLARSPHRRHTDFSSRALRSLTWMATSMWADLVQKLGDLGPDVAGGESPLALEQVLPQEDGRARSRGRR